MKRRQRFSRNTAENNDNPAQPDAAGQSPTRQSHELHVSDRRSQGGPISRRNRPAKAPLSREAILSAALEIVDEQGMDAVSMRSVAKKLDTGPSSLYVYIQNRDDLIREMVDAAYANINIPDPNGESWQTRAKAIVLGMFDVLIEHPGLASVTFGDMPAGPQQYRVVGELVTAMQDGGLDINRIAWLCDILGMLGNAAAIEQESLGAIFGDAEADEDQVVELFRGMLKSMPRETYPTLGLLPYYMSRSSTRTRLAWICDVLLAGAATVPLPPAENLASWDAIWRAVGIPLPDNPEAE